MSRDSSNAKTQRRKVAKILSCPCAFASLRLCVLLLLTTQFSSHADDLLLYVPFDRSADAAIAGGSAENAGGLGLSFAPGLRGEAAVLRNDCRYRVAGNFRPEQGTIAMWVRPHWSGADPTGHVLFCLYGQRDLPHSWAVNRFDVGCGAGRCTFTVFTKTEGVTHRVEAPIASWRAEEWHHVAVTWSGVNSGQANSEIKLYLDGAHAGTLTGKRIDVGPTDEVMAVGRDQDASPDYADADVDDFFVYGRALTEEEIAQAVATVRQGVAYEAPAATTSASLVKGWWNALWPFRVQVALPQEAMDRKEVFVQCPFRAGSDLASLGLTAAISPDSIRVVEAEKGLVPFRFEDNMIEWQTSAPIPAGAARRFYLYFQTNRYKIIQPLVSQRETAPSEKLPPALLPPDYASLTYGKPWNFDDGTLSGIDQWGNKPEFLRNRKVENGLLSMDVTQDPWFIWGDMWGQVAQSNQKVTIDLDRFPILEMKVRQNVGSAVWELYGRPGVSDQLLHHQFLVEGTGWQRIRIDLKKEARWRGVLSAFRIDPTMEVEAHVEIDWVRLISATPVEHARVETLGEPGGTPARVQLNVPKTTITAGAAQEIVVAVRNAGGKPIAHQPVRVELTSSSRGEFADSEKQKSLALSRQARRGLTDESGQLVLKYVASQRARNAADTLITSAEFAETSGSKVVVNTLPGPAHHYLVQPSKVVALKPNDLPLAVSAQLVDELDNPVAGARKLTWTTEEGGSLTVAAATSEATGRAKATWRGDESKRWVYRVRVKDAQGLTGESAPICLLPSQPRKDPIVLGSNGYFRKGKDGPVWLPLGGFYANWVGVPEGGEEGRRLISFVDATEEQLDHWLQFLHRQGVTAMRFMLRAHTPKGMEPMDVVGRVNMQLFAKVLRYLDLARKYDLRFMLTIHEDYTKPAYYDQHALETFCLPQYQGEDLDKLPPHQRRFVRDRKLLGLIGEKYTDPDVKACQDQYARQLVGLLKDNPQLFAWEFENEMVDCPQSWANHAAAVLRSVDPITPICASHGGGGMHTADPMWWTGNTSIDFYAYHLYGYDGIGSTSELMDYGGAADVLTCYGRMAGVCMLGESAGDEFSYYPKERDADRRYLMRDLIWFSLVNGNPGCFYWNSRGYEVQQFRLANKVTARIDWKNWRRQKPEVGIVVTHPLDDDKYYRSPQGGADYAMMCRYAQHFLSRGIDFDFTTTPEGYAKTAALQTFASPESAARVSVSEGFQIRTNAREGYGDGIAYLRNFAGMWHWQTERANMWIRNRKPAPLIVRFNLPVKEIEVTATDLDTGEEKTVNVAGQSQIDLGVTDHDWALVWRVR
ncbi:MAG: LamG domain-containing protein [Armatimonadetes bacterium]|nr:LamG domain-containing protein [Armatimonadota bacterium]